jgi:hypothetical protein
MSIEELSPEELARVFFHYLEALGPDFGGPNQQPHSWNETSQREQKRMIAAARLALLEIQSAERSREDEDRRRYYPQPGSADWGC